MKFDTYVFVICILMVFLIGSATTFLVTIINGTNGSSVIQECEKALPRDQHCILKAIPAEVKL